MGVTSKATPVYTSRRVSDVVPKPHNISYAALSRENPGKGYQAIWPRYATPTSTSPGSAARATSPPPGVATSGPAARPPAPSTPRDPHAPLQLTAAISHFAKPLLHVQVRTRTRRGFAGTILRERHRYVWLASPEPSTVMAFQPRDHEGEPCRQRKSPTRTPRISVFPGRKPMATSRRSSTATQSTCPGSLRMTALIS